MLSIFIEKSSSTVRMLELVRLKLRRLLNTGRINYAKKPFRSRNLLIKSKPLKDKLSKLSNKLRRKKNSVTT